MSHHKRYILEICANSIQSAINAQSGGADRIELCQNLDVGGLTPSYGLIQIVKQELSITVHVLIRPRAGNFIYNDTEFAIMLADIQACHALGCDGVVIGMLDRELQVDVSRVRQLVQAALPMHVTFHRAFDSAINKYRALEDVIAAGCSRVLTVGGPCSRVHENAYELAELVSAAAARITIMPGGGLSVEHLEILTKKTNAVEFHGSARQKLMRARSENADGVFQNAEEETSATVVASWVGVLRSLDSGI